MSRVFSFSLMIATSAAAMLLATSCANRLDGVVEASVSTTVSPSGEVNSASTEAGPTTITAIVTTVKTATASKSVQQSKKPTTAGGIGDGVVFDESLTCTVLRLVLIEPGSDGDAYQLVGVVVEISNIGTENSDFVVDQVELKDRSGAVAEFESSYPEYLAPEGTLRPGEKRTGTLTFLVNSSIPFGENGAPGLVLLLHSSGNGPDSQVKLG